MCRICPLGNYNFLKGFRSLKRDRYWGLYNLVKCAHIQASINTFIKYVIFINSLGPMSQTTYSLSHWWLYRQFWHEICIKNLLPESPINEWMLLSRIKKYKCSVCNCNLLNCWKCVFQDRKYSDLYKPSKQFIKEGAIDWLFSSCSFWLKPVWTRARKITNQPTADCISYMTQGYEWSVSIAHIPCYKIW